MSQDRKKRQVAEAAFEKSTPPDSETPIGIGTGSTANCYRCSRRAKSILGVFYPTTEDRYHYGIELLDLNATGTCPSMLMELMKQIKLNRSVGALYREKVLLKHLCNSCTWTTQNGLTFLVNFRSVEVIPIRSCRPCIS